MLLIESHFLTSANLSEHNKMVPLKAAYGLFLR